MLERYVIPQWQCLVILTCLILLSNCSGQRQPMRTFSLLTREQALATLQDIRQKEGSLISPEWKLPSASDTTLPLYGASVDGTGRVILAAASRGLMTGISRPRPPGANTSANSIDDEVYFFQGVFYTSVDLEVVERQSFQYSFKEQWKSGNGKIPKGVYIWYVGLTGIYLDQQEQGILIRFQSPAESALDRRNIDFSVSEGKADRLLIPIGNQKISLR